MAEGERFSFRKLFGGIFDGKNHAKVIVFVAIIGIWFCVYQTISGFANRFNKPSVGIINSGGAPVDNSTKKSFWSLFYFGGQNQ